MKEGRDYFLNSKEFQQAVEEWAYFFFENEFLKCTEKFEETDLLSVDKTDFLDFDKTKETDSNKELGPEDEELDDLNNIKYVVNFLFLLSPRVLPCNSFFH